MSRHLVVAGWLLDDAPSGASRRLLGLVRAAVPRLGPGGRLTVLHRPDHRPALPEGVQSVTVDLPAGPTWRRARAERRRLPGLLRELGATSLDQAFLPLVHGLPCPAVVTVHDLRDLDGWRRRAPRPLLRALHRRALAPAARVAAPSAFTAARLRAHGLTREVAIVPGGVELPPPGNPPPEHPPYVLHVGHLEPRKNLGVLVDALAHIPGLHLVLAGADHGTGRHLRARAHTAGLDDRVHFRGVLDDPTVTRLYAGATAIAVPSRYEGFGLPALEGLAHGRPVLVADAGALPEVVGDAGTVLPPSDARAWAQALQSLDHDDATARSCRARAAALSWDRAADAWLALHR